MASHPLRSFGCDMPDEEFAEANEINIRKRYKALFI